MDFLKPRWDNVKGETTLLLNSHSVYQFPFSPFVPCLPLTYLLTPPTTPHPPSPAPMPLDALVLIPFLTLTHFILYILYFMHGL